MRDYKVIDESGATHHYEASDMRMALWAHHKVVGTEPVRAKEIGRKRR